MRNARLDEAQAGIKTARRNINNLSCADDTILMAESEEELKSLLMKVQEGFSNTTIQKHQFFSAQLSSQSNSHIHTWPLTRRTFASKVMSLLFNMLSRFVITFLPRRKRLLISWLQSPSAVILEPKKIKSVTVSIFFPVYFPWSDGTGCHDLCFLNVEL